LQTFGCFLEQGVTQEEPHIPPVNRSAVISIVAALLTVVSFCGAVIPVPLTGLLCYPLAAILGIVAFVAGLISLRQIHSTGEKGRSLALVGSGVGGLAVTGLLYAMALGILFYAKIADFVSQITRWRTIQHAPVLANP
jgi:hypothetical protein